MESMFQEMAELWLGNIRCRDEELTTWLLSYLLTGSETVHCSKFSMYQALPFYE